LNVIGEKMDNYTKVLLSVIAGSLLLLNIQLSGTSIITDAFAKGDCGEKRYKPCYVKVIK
tara:strand:- start:151 stop:330 length:180 start_codon:yes stop_codon:yes gene_type:complete